MTEYSTLVSAISDVGYWRWWSEKLPALFQLEFGGVQIYTPPEDKSKPPSGLLALRFLRPSLVSFMRREANSSDPPADWPRLLKEEKIRSFGVSHDQFALNDEDLYEEVVGQMESEQVHFTDDSVTSEVRLAFWAGVVGMRIESREMRPVLMSGETQLSTIDSLHGDWWSYWRDYWSKREAADAYPKDYACEVTIPLKPE